MRKAERKKDPGKQNARWVASDRKGIEKGRQAKTTDSVVRNGSGRSNETSSDDTSSDAME